MNKSTSARTRTGRETPRVKRRQNTQKAPAIGTQKAGYQKRFLDSEIEHFHDALQEAVRTASYEEALFKKLQLDCAQKLLMDLGYVEVGKDR